MTKFAAMNHTACSGSAACCAESAASCADTARAAACFLDAAVVLASIFVAVLVRAAGAGLLPLVLIILALLERAGRTSPLKGQRAVLMY